MQCGNVAYTTTIRVKQTAKEKSFFMLYNINVTFFISPLFHKLQRITKSMTLPASPEQSFFHNTDGIQIRSLNLQVDKSLDQ